MIIRFIISGSIGAAVNLALLYILADLSGIWYLYSATIAFLISSIVSFILQKVWTFGNGDMMAVQTQAAYYLSTGLINLVVNALLVFLMVDYAGINHIIAEALSSIAIAIYSFAIYSHIFKKA